MSNLNNIFLEEGKMKEWTILLKSCAILNISFNLDTLSAGIFPIRLQRV